MSSDRDIALSSEWALLDCGLKSRRIPLPLFLFIPLILGCFCLFKLQKRLLVIFPHQYVPEQLLNNSFSCRVRAWAVVELESRLLLIARQLLYGLITSGPAGEESKEEGHTGVFFSSGMSCCSEVAAESWSDSWLNVFVLKCWIFKLLCFRTRTVLTHSCWVSKPRVATQFCVCIRCLHDLLCQMLANSSYNFL